MQAIINLIGETTIKGGLEFGQKYLSDHAVRTAALSLAKQYLINKTGSDETEVLCNAVWNKFSYTTTAKTDLMNST